MSNLILIGMPASGKSTAGVVLAKLLGYRFLDTDLLIQNRRAAACPRFLRTGASTASWPPRRRPA